MVDQSEPWLAGEGNADSLLEEGIRQLAGGDVDEARRYFTRALEAFRRLRDLEGQAAALQQLAEIEWRAGHAADADARLAQVRALCEGPEAGVREANILRDLAEVQRRCRREALARETLSLAGAISERAGDLLGRAHAEFRLGALFGRSNPRIAHQHYELAASLYEEVDRQLPVPAIRLADPALPQRVDDPTEIEPFIMWKVALREASRLIPKSTVRVADAPVVPTPQSGVAASRPHDLVAGGVILALVSVVFVVVGAIATSRQVPLLPVGYVATTLFAFAAAGAAAFGARTSGVQSKPIFWGSVVATFAAVQLGGLVFFHSHKTPTLVERYADSLPSEPQQLGAALIQLAEQAQARHADAEARDAYAQALRLFQQLKDRRGQADVLRSQGQMELEANEARQALLTYAQSLGLYRELNQTPERFAVAVKLADLQRSFRQYDEARSVYAEAAQLAGDLHQPNEELRLLRRRSEMDAKLGRRKEARAGYMQALQRSRDLKDLRGTAKILVRLGVLDQGAQAFDEGRKELNEAITLYQKLNDPGTQARSLVHLGDLEASAGKYDEAAAAYGKALERLEPISDAMGQAKVYRSMGRLERQRKQPALAESPFKRAAAIYDREVNRPATARTLMELAALFSANGEPEAARAQYERARALFEQALNPRGQAQALLATGEIDAKLKGAAAAAESMTRALRLFEQAEDVSGQVAALSRLGELLKLDNPKLAQQYSERAALLQKPRSARSAPNS